MNYLGAYVVVLYALIGDRYMRYSLPNPNLLLAGVILRLVWVWRGLRLWIGQSMLKLRSPDIPLSDHTNGIFIAPRRFGIIAIQTSS